MYSPDCAECGGGALQVACLVCTGTCGAMWNRAMLDSNDSGQAHWVGQCYHQVDRYAEPQNTPRVKVRHLFCFGYQTVEQLRLNAAFDDDAESSARVFIEASSKREAAELGRLYADLFVMHEFGANLSNLRSAAYRWSESGFSEWLEEDLQEIAQAERANVPIITSADQILSLF